MQVHVNLIGRKDLSGEIYRQLRQAMVDGRLASEGFVASRVGAGTYVSKPVAPARPRATKRHGSVGALRPQAVWDSIRLSTAFASSSEFDFRTGLPDATLFPHDMWRRLMARELRYEAISGGVYSHPAGHRGLREAIARHIGISRGIAASADDVTITSGAQQALDIVARSLLAPGDRIAVEDPGYTPPQLLFKSLGAKIYGIPIAEQGIVVDALQRHTRLVYVTPSHQYPLGVTLSLPRRLALLDWAERNNAGIIEDDYDSEFRFEGRPLEPLQTLDTSGRVIYVGSFSKSLLPALRLGFLVTPPCCTLAVQKAKYVTDWHTSMLAQAALARFIEDGGFARHIRKISRVYN